MGGATPKITFGTTGLHEILGRDYGFEEPYDGVSVKLTLNNRTGELVDGKGCWREGWSVVFWSLPIICTITVFTRLNTTVEAKLPIDAASYEKNETVIGRVQEKNGSTL